MSINMGLSDVQRETMAKAVTAVLADTYALYFKTHVYHWNVTGPRFHDLHALFELLLQLGLPCSKLGQARIKGLLRWCFRMRNDLRKLIVQRLYDTRVESMTVSTGDLHAA